MILGAGMSEQTRWRADELLAELTELVETARALPLSSSIVLPRERVLDLLDELHQRMPADIEQARRVLADREQMLLAAHTEATERRNRASEQADALIADATHRSGELLKQAELRAHELAEQGQQEHTRLVSATTVHQAAVARAAELAAEADDRFARVQAEADSYAVQVRGQADRNAATVANGAQAFADRTLAELADTLRRSVALAESGRSALARRRSGYPGAGGPPGAEPLPEALLEPLFAQDSGA
jgi:hypothetical protein